MSSSSVSISIIPTGLTSSVSIPAAISGSTATAGTATFNLGTSSSTLTSLSETIFTGTQTALPTAQSCSGGISSPDTRNPACAVPASNFSSSILRSCCNDAPRFLYVNNCNIYCEAKNQTLEELNDCIKERWSNATGLFIVCNRGGESFSSTVLAETQTQLGTGTSTSTSTQTGGAVNWRRGRDGLISKGGWTAAFVVAGSMVAGLMTE